VGLGLALLHFTYSFSFTGVIFHLPFPNIRGLSGAPSPFISFTSPCQGSFIPASLLLHPYFLKAIATSLLFKAITASAALLFFRGPMPFQPIALDYFMPGTNFMH
jgi:hypothetical protein